MSEHDRPESTPASPGFPPPPSTPAAAPPAAATPAAMAAGPPPPRWVVFLSSIGLGLTAVITVQVLAAIAEAVSMKRTDPTGVRSDLFHHLGYAFQGLGGTSLLFLVVAVVLVTLPVVLEARMSERHDTIAAVALGLSVVMAVIIGIGSILAVRYTLHLYSAAHRSVPSYARIQLVFFLLGALGTAAIALFGALSALGMRDNRAGPGQAEAS
jgi:hypothetical protein